MILLNFIKDHITILILVCCAAACGGSGSGNKGGGSTPPPPAPPTPKALHTTVGIHANEYLPLNVSSCFRYAEYSLPKTSADFAVDGNLEDWAKVPAHLTDALSDAAGPVDLGEVAVAAAGANDPRVALGLAFIPTGDTNLFIELGGVLSRDEDIYSEVKHLFRFGVAGNFEFRSRGWEALGSDLVQIVSGVNGTEIVLSDRLTGDTTSWPAWWVRVIAHNEVSGATDSTHAAYFPSILGGNANPFTFEKCIQWNGKPAKVSQVMITHHIPPPKNPTPDDVADGSFDIRRAHALQLSRFALDLANSLSGELHYGATVNTLMVSEKVPGGIMVPIGPDHPLVATGATLRMLGATTKNMGFIPTVYFPQGDVIDRSVQFHLNQMLQTTFPHAGRGLTAFTAKALAHLFVKKYIGPQYWFNHRHQNIATLLAHPDSDAPRGLDALAEDLVDLKADQESVNEFYEAKLHAAAQLLGEHFSVDEIAGAWVETAVSASAATPSEAIAAKFVEILFSELEEKDTRQGMQSMFDGYLNSSPYSADFALAAHEDRDLDGFPMFMERKFGTSDTSADSDHDGWSDLVEHTAGFDPNSASQVPGKIVADGLFSEWQNLLASKINIDKGHSGVCTKDADIEFYAAVASADHLVIGGVAQEFWRSESRARWEAVIDIPSENRTLLVIAPSNERKVQIKDPVTNKIIMTYALAVPAGGKVAEIQVDRQSMRLATPFNKENGIKIRLRTAYEADEGNIFCDETGWFAPYVR